MATEGQGPDINIFDEFIEDYFAESEEHLTSIQSLLLSLEAFVHKSKVDASLLKDLMLHFHSLKGLSAMVSLSEAERLSHKIESYIRELLDEKVILTTEAMDTVIAGTNLLEEVIVARRKRSEMPGIELVMGKLSMILSDDASEPETGRAQSAIPELHPK